MLRYVLRRIPASICSISRPNRGAGCTSADTEITFSITFSRVRHLAQRGYCRLSRMTGDRHVRFSEKGFPVGKSLLDYGKCWGNGEIDLIALDMKHRVAYVRGFECRSESVGMSELNSLMRKVKDVKDVEELKDYRIRCCLFSVSGFREGMENSDAILFNMGNQSVDDRCVVVWVVKWGRRGRRPAFIIVFGSCANTRLLQL